MQKTLQDITPETDVHEFQSKKTGRGKLPKDWIETTKPVMCCYKVRFLHLILSIFEMASSINLVLNVFGRNPQLLTILRIRMLKSSVRVIFAENYEVMVPPIFVTFIMISGSTSSFQNARISNNGRAHTSEAVPTNICQVQSVRVIYQSFCTTFQCIRKFDSSRNEEIEECIRC